MIPIPSLIFILSSLLGLEKEIAFEQVSLKMNLITRQGELMLEKPKVYEAYTLSEADSLKLYGKKPPEDALQRVKISDWQVQAQTGKVSLKLESDDSQKLIELLELREVTGLEEDMPPHLKPKFQGGRLVMVLFDDFVDGTIETNGEILRLEEEKLYLVLWKKDTPSIEIKFKTPFRENERYLELKH